MLKHKIVVAFLILLLSCFSNADVSHYFAPEFNNYYHQHQQHQQQQQLQQGHPFQFSFAPPQAHIPSSLYNAPSPVVPNPVPVAPVTSTTTEFTLPEIIENRLAKDPVPFIPLSNEYLPPHVDRPNYESPKPPSNGYYYPRPTPSTTTTIKTTTGYPRPIVVQDPGVDDSSESINVGSEHEGYDYNAPLPVVIVPATKPSTPAPVYLPPESEQNDIVEFNEGSNPLRLRVKEMRCLNHHDGYFRTVIKVDSFISAAPTVDNDSFDKHCELKLSRSYVILDIGADDFQRCGVRECGKDLCLRVRFPAIRGMRTGVDAILTLHCKTQDRVAVKTHALKMGIANDIQARSIGTYAHGGTQNPLRTHCELLRKSNNGYTRHLAANDAVQLGEELLLRAHVLAGDGWNYTKLTDVSLQRFSPSGELLNTAQLITPHGCLNPSMKSICAHAPSFDPPLGHKLAFRAVMFQGMRNGDELVVSMRLTGCLAQHDCQIQVQECNVPAINSRRRRDTDSGASKNSTETSEISQISFRVVMRGTKDKEMSSVEELEPIVMKSGGENSETFGSEVVRSEMQSFALIGSLGFVTILICLAIFVSVKFQNSIQF